MSSPGKKTRRNILLSAVIGPHGVDGPHSRYKNPMSLLGNQVTRGQQHYTVQAFSRTFAYDLLGANLDANVAILDFPTEEQLRVTLRERRWDRIGLSGIMANFEKVLVTYRIVREILPDTPIDIGGHIVNDDDVTREMILRMRALFPAETFHSWEPAFEAGAPSVLSTWIAAQGCAGQGVVFVKRDGLEYYANLPGIGLKGQDVIHAPLVGATFDKRAMGLKLEATSAGLIIPDVGCPMRCDFCTTSAKFDGRFVKFLSSAEDILAVADGHAKHGINDMFVMSENFSLDAKRARELLRLMEVGRKPYTYAVFSSADALSRLGIETIVKLGYSFVWIGLEESTGTTYHKMNGVGLHDLIAQLQGHGVDVLGSTILGFPDQTVADVDREIEHALSYGCTFNQFMLYMAMPGTALWKKMQAEERLKEGFPWVDIHGQHVQNWKHPHLSDEVMSQKLDFAFERDFEVLGPSILRTIQTHWNGYRATANWDHELVQMRRARTRKKLFFFALVLDAMRGDLKSMGNATFEKARVLRDDLLKECGWKAKLASFVASPFVARKLKAERRRYEESVRTQTAPEPACQVTHYGLFEKTESLVVPAPGPTPELVPIAIATPGKSARTIEPAAQVRLGRLA